MRTTLWWLECCPRSAAVINICMLQLIMVVCTTLTRAWTTDAHNQPVTIMIAGITTMGSCPLCGMRLPEGPQLKAHVTAELEALDAAEWTDVPPADRGRAVSTDDNSRSETVRATALCNGRSRSALCGQSHRSRDRGEGVGIRVSGRDIARNGVPTTVVRRGAAAKPARRQQRSCGKHCKADGGAGRSGRRSSHTDASSVRFLQTSRLNIIAVTFFTSPAACVLARMNPLQPP